MPTLSLMEVARQASISMLPSCNLCRPAGAEVPRYILGNSPLTNVRGQHVLQKRAFERKPTIAVWLPSS
jgi:hypothetical protein